jgi:hypothetical protein
VFWPSDRFIIGKNILGHALYRGQKNFHNMDYMAIKKRRISFTRVAKCTSKEIFHGKDFRLYTGKELKKFLFLNYRVLIFPAISKPCRLFL